MKTLILPPNEGWEFLQKDLWGGCLYKIYKKPAPTGFYFRLTESQVMEFDEEQNPIEFFGEFPIAEIRALRLHLR